MAKFSDTSAVYSIEEIRYLRYRLTELEGVVKDYRASIDARDNSIRKLNRFISEHGLGEEYIAWIIAKRLTTGEEP